MTRESLVDDGGVREAVSSLKDVRSIVDVDVYVWSEEKDRWRRLTFTEARALWSLSRE